MLREISDVRQIEGEPRRAWYFCHEQDLVVWFDGEGVPCAFQLAYDKGVGEHSITWSRERGYRHWIVRDDGRNATPLLYPAGPFSKEIVLRSFLSLSAELPVPVVELVEDRLGRCDESCQVVIRKLSSHDAAEYQQLRLRGLREDPSAFSSSHEEEVDRSLAEIVARLTPAQDGAPFVLGGFVDDELRGMLAFWRPSSAKLSHCADLGGMYVAPEYRSRGIARALLGSSLELARAVEGVLHVKLTVNASNQAARSLYRSMGFTCFGVQPDALWVDGRFYDEEFYMRRLDRPGPVAIGRGLRA
jgi:RimJ/RimL family protein N-acetyltransferase